MLDMGKHIDRANDGLVAIIHHLSQIQESMLDLVDQTSQREPTRWSLEGSVVSAAGGQVGLLQGQLPRVPMGKRFVAKRLVTSAPSAVPCFVYANLSGLPDPQSIREVIPNATNYADAIRGDGTVVDGGIFFFPIWQGGTAGSYTFRAEGLLFPDVMPGDVGH